MQMQKVKVIAGERTAPGNVKCKREIALSRNSSDFVDLIQRSDWIFKDLSILKVWVFILKVAKSR